MTAFSSVQMRFEWGLVCWELRSVNHRFLELNFRLPDTLREIETELRDSGRARLERGKIDATLRVDVSSAAGIAVNLELARQLLDACDSIGRLLTDPAPVSALDILRWPGVLAEPDVDAAGLRSAAVTVFDAGLQQLLDAREREGNRLGQLIGQRLAGISAEIASVRARLPQLLAGQRRKLLERLTELTTAPDSDRLEQELLYVAQRADVEEELDRLATHSAEVERLLAGTQAVGRRLDFLMQEFNREANTLAAKSLDSACTRSAIEMKVLIEQMREQIQNLE